jgi:hypothetical protein
MLSIIGHGKWDIVCYSSRERRDEKNELSRFIHSRAADEGRV